jgi:hypothetical protein
VDEVYVSYHKISAGEARQMGAQQRTYSCSPHQRF